MAQFSMGIRVVSRGKGQSIMAAAAYRAGEKLWDERLGIFHDFRHKAKGVEHTELLFPANAPAWTEGIDRETFWAAVDASERRRDAQMARDLRIMIPREVPPSERVALVRDYVQQTFVSKGMVADLCFHNYITASDGLEQPHCHILFSMRPLVAEGFGNKSRHDMVPDPSGRTLPNGRPLMVESNPHSWNSATFFSQAREGWETIANAALERAGSDQRIDRRSLLERGLARMPEPALRLAYHLKDLRGALKERFGQWQCAQLYKDAERRAKSAFARLEDGPTRTGDTARKAHRFWDWLDRHIENLVPDRAAPDRAPPRQPGFDMER